MIPYFPSVTELQEQAALAAAGARLHLREKDYEYAAMLQDYSARKYARAQGIMYGRQRESNDVRIAD